MKEVEKKIVEEEVEVKVEDLQSQVVMKENSSHIETNLTWGVIIAKGMGILRKNVIIQKKNG